MSVNTAVRQKMQALSQQSKMSLDVEGGRIAVSTQGPEKEILRTYFEMIGEGLNQPDGIRDTFALVREASATLGSEDDYAYYSMPWRTLTATRDALFLFLTGWGETQDRKDLSWDDLRDALWSDKNRDFSEKDRCQSMDLLLGGLRAVGSDAYELMIDVLEYGDVDEPAIFQ